MVVADLISILKKCDPSAEVSFCYGDSGRIDTAEFVEFDTTSNKVFLYEDEPGWGVDSSLDTSFEVNIVTSINKRFAETTYKVVS